MAENPASMSPPKATLLARYAGERPDAPDWFRQAISTPYDEYFIDVDGAKIRYQTWGKKGNPGLFLVHGNAAHAHWYDFIAPSFAEDYHVVAMTFSGMGESGWRDHYSFAQFTAEQIAVCQASGLFDEGRKPILLAHSFGGSITLHTAVNHSDRFAGVIILDSRLMRPDEDWRGTRPSREHRAYASLQAGLARFRLEPAQPCDNHFLVDYIARHSLKQIENSAGQTAWTWKFDPHMLSDFDLSFITQNVLAEVACPLTVIRGQDSVTVTDELWEYLRTLRDDMEMISIAAAGHHVMLDQPLVLIDEVKTQLKFWQH